MRGLPKSGSMSQTAPILIQLKQWCESEIGQRDTLVQVSDGWQAKKNSKHVTLTDLSALCWHSINIYCRRSCEITEWRLDLTVNFFVFYNLDYKHDDDTSKHVLNLSSYMQDEPPESAHFTWVLLEDKKAWGRQGWSGRNLLGVWLHVFEWFFTPPPPLWSPPFRNWGLLR